MSHYTPSIHDVPPFSPLFSPSQESSPHNSLYSPSPSPTPLAQRTKQLSNDQHRFARPTQPPQQRTALPVPHSTSTMSQPHHNHRSAYYHSEEPPPSDVDVLLSPSFSLPLSNSDNSAPQSPTFSPSPQLQSPFTPNSPAASSSSASTSGSSGGPITLHPWQLSLFHTHYPNLSQLNLSHNRLIGLCSFHSLAYSLRTLNLAYNLLSASSLPHLAPLTALNVLSLAYNNIESLSLMPPLPALTSLDLSSNALALTPHHLTAPINRSMPMLQRLTLSGNPFCSSDRGYRLRVVDALRDCTHLTWLDGLPLEEERRGISEQTAEEERKEQAVTDDAGDDGVERHRGPHGTAKRAASMDDDSKYDTSAVPFPNPTTAASLPLFTSPFLTPQQPRPHNSHSQPLLSAAPITHCDVDETSARPATAPTATPLAPTHSTPVAVAGPTHTITITQAATPFVDVATAMPHSTSLPALSSHQSSAASTASRTVSHNSEQESRIAALEDELRRMRLQQQRDTPTTPVAAAATALVTMKDEASPLVPPASNAQAPAIPSKPSPAAHVVTAPLPLQHNAAAILSPYRASGPLQPSFPPTAFSSSSAVSHSSHSALLFDLQQSRRQCDDLRAQLAGLHHALTLHEQTIAQRLNVDSGGLALWRHALVQLVKKQKEEEEQRERREEEKRDADRRWQQEREQKAAEMDVMRRTAEKAREEVWKREDELSRMRIQQSHSDERIEQIEQEKARQAVQLQEASSGLVALRASQQSVGASFERAERLLATTLARLHFACQRVAVIKQLHFIDGTGGAAKTAASNAVSTGVGTSKGHSAPLTSPLVLNDDTLLLKRELERLRADNAMLLQRHADAVASLRAENAKQTADSAALARTSDEQLNSLRLQYSAAMDDNARLTAELTDARAALSRHQCELVDELDSVRRAGERLADERCDRLKCEVKAARDEVAALQRDAVNTALEMRRMQRTIDKINQHNNTQDDERRRTAEDELRRRDQRIERLEREKEELSRRWRQMLPQAITQRTDSSGLSERSGASGASGQAGNGSVVSVSAKLNSLAALSMKLLEDDADDD